MYNNVCKMASKMDESDESFDGFEPWECELEL